MDETPEQYLRRVCWGKIRYSGRKEAALVVKNMNQRGHSGNQPYRCPHCGHWHVGHRRSKKELRTR